MVMRLAQVMRTGRGLSPVSVEELSLDLNSKEVSQRALSRVLRCLAPPQALDGPVSGPDILQGRRSLSHHPALSTGPSQTQTE
ncbi:hypothetical protein AALO_G00302490 [Alosa alosa]|uniref:Uncharacterized protein n=1 Tax=Alosa alosa TaxID=278164 RepID=A0AAV6FJI6_9TELE|nr:hypothetical protein AALO_G00302490 [Alosa alosa]